MGTVQQTKAACALLGSALSAMAVALLVISPASSIRSNSGFPIGSGLQPHPRPDTGRLPKFTIQEPDQGSQSRVQE
jgi:hypothetical protein